MPNTPVPAAGGAMPADQAAPSRRRFLQGATVTAALVGTATAAVALDTEGELERLMATHRAAATRLDDAHEVEEDCETTFRSHDVHRSLVPLTVPPAEVVPHVSRSYAELSLGEEEIRRRILREHADLRMKREDREFLASRKRLPVMDAHPHVAVWTLSAIEQSKRDAIEGLYDALLRMDEVSEAVGYTDAYEATKAARNEEQATLQALLAYRPRTLAEVAKRFAYLINDGPRWDVCVPDEDELEILFASMTALEVTNQSTLLK